MKAGAPSQATTAAIIYLDEGSDIRVVPFRSEAEAEASLAGEHPTENIAEAKAILIVWTEHGLVTRDRT